MISVKGSVAQIKFNVKGYLDEVFTALDVELRNAGAAWAREVIPRIPVYTGTSRGVLAPIAKMVGVDNPFVAPVNEAAARKKYFIYPKGGTKWPLGFDEGASYSTTLFTKTFTGTGTTFRFEFGILLPYLKWNERQAGPSWFPFQTPPPYLFLEYGKEAFKEYCRIELPKNLPQYKDFITFRINRIR